MARQTLTDRQKRILTALIRTHVATAAPVASGALARAFRGRWSSATIRNVLSALEDAGYLWQPHTSAGRIPSDAGYRFYVDSVPQHRDVSADEVDQIGAGLSALADDLEDMLERASEMLASLARHAGVGAALSRPLGLRFIRLFSVDSRHAVLLVMAASGAMATEVIEVPEGVSAEDLECAATRINTICAGRSYETVASVRAAEDDPRPAAVLLRRVLSRVQDVLATMRQTRVAVHGAQYLFEQPEFQSLDSVSSIMRAFDQRRAIANMLQAGSGGLRVTIGGEINNASMCDCSVVAANFSAGTRAAGAVGVIGPKRMHYERMMALVEAVAGAMSRALAGGEETGS